MSRPEPFPTLTSEITSHRSTHLNTKDVKRGWKRIREGSPAGFKACVSHGKESVWQRESFAPSCQNSLGHLADARGRRRLGRNDGRIL